MGEVPYIRTSERKAFGACPQLWWWSWVEGLRPSGPPDTALWFGTGVHYALAEWYKPGFRRGVRPATTWNKWLTVELDGEEVRAGYQTIRREGQSVEEPVFVDARELGTSMLRRYVDYYGKDEELETLAVEQPFQVEIYDGRTKGAGPIAYFSGTFDGVALDHEDGQTYLWEHKTAAAISTAFLALDAQAGGYYAVATTVLRSLGMLGPKEAISGVLYNYLRKAKPDPREQNEDGLYLNKNGEVSQKQPAPEFVREVIERNPAEVNSQLRRLRDEVEIMNGIRAGSIPLVKNTNWKCPWCPMFDLCKLDEKGNKRAVREYKAAAFDVTDPYADHRKSASE